MKKLINEMVAKAHNGDNNIIETNDFRAGLKEAIKQLQPTFYYEWGNEPKGKVSTGTYNEKEVFVNTGYVTKAYAVKNKLFFHNPHS